MKLKLEAHDLLWGMTVDYIADDAPLWAKEVLLRGDPVVVRREITPENQVAVGVRGQFRYQRYAAQMPRSAISRQLKPEALTRVDTQQFEHLGRTFTDHFQHYEKLFRMLGIYRKFWV